MFVAPSRREPRSQFPRAFNAVSLGVQNMNSSYETTCRGTFAACCFLLIFFFFSIFPICAGAQTSSAPYYPPRGLSDRADESDSADSTFGGYGLLRWFMGSNQQGTCPLRTTDYSVQVSGYVAKVTVKQKFSNPCKKNIEAVYTFPLSANGAVEEMFIEIGDRKIQGQIRDRDEAAKLYATAKYQGHTAALLEEQRSNVFTQSIANIEPGNSVVVTLKYTEVLDYRDGAFSLVLPTVVGPRFSPRCPLKANVGSISGNTDASKLSPPILPVNKRAEHDVSIAVNLNAGVQTERIFSTTHPILTERSSKRQARIKLAHDRALPNRDFVLKWEVAQSDLKLGCVSYTNKNEKPGYFSLMLIPPERVTTKDASPKEMIFLIDCSGSQAGLPLEQAKGTLNYILDHMNPQDTFQIVAFSDTQSILFQSPQSANPVMLAKAKLFIAALSADGGTWMAPAVEAICKVPADKNRLRIVTFMTDGYVGNDLEIQGLVRKYRGSSRWFSFGTGGSVNRSLIEGIAREGGGEAEYVPLNANTKDIAAKFYARISTPVLADVRVSFEGLQTSEVYPAALTDLWAQRPVCLTGRFRKPGQGTVVLSGLRRGMPYEKRFEVCFPSDGNQDSSIGSMWARAKCDDLLARDFLGAHQGELKKELKQMIVATALEHHIMTPYTSFLAVETKRRVEGVPEKVVVPVMMPHSLPNHNTSINETYRGMHQWYKDDLVGNLASNIGQLVGKWLSEFIWGACADCTRTVTQALCEIYSLSARPTLWSSLVVVYTVEFFCLTVAVYAMQLLRQRKGKVFRVKSGQAWLLLSFAIIFPLVSWFCFVALATFVLGSSAGATNIGDALWTLLGASSREAGAAALVIFSPILANFSLGSFAPAIGSCFYFAALLLLAALAAVIVGQLVLVALLQMFRIFLALGLLFLAPIAMFASIQSGTRVCTIKLIRSFVEINSWGLAYVLGLKAIELIVSCNFYPSIKLVAVAAVLQFVLWVPQATTRSKCGLTMSELENARQQLVRCLRK